MGWDTQVGILIEELSDEKEAILSLFFADPPLIYLPIQVFERFIEQQSVLYLTYEGRKHPPVAWFDKISAIHSKPIFTLLGSHIDFLCGPAGLIKLKAGEILDSYAYFDRFTDYEDYYHPEYIYQWFGLPGPENHIRQNHLTQIPACNHDGDLISRLIELDDNNKLKLANLKATLLSPENYGWKLIKHHKD